MTADQKQPWTEGNVRLFRAAMDALDDAIYLVDATTLSFIDVNEAGCRAQGRTREEVFALGPATILGITRDELHSTYAALIERSTGTEVLELLRPRPKGTQAWVELRRRALRLEEGWIIVTVVRDITERKEMQERLLQMAHYDSLTDLPNRALCYDRLNQALIQARRRSGSVALLFVDLDHFKTVNDTLGHSFGDQLLKQVSERLRQCVRGEDTVGRLGGDEFVIVLPALAEVRYAGLVARKAIDALAQPFTIDAHEVRISASIGIAVSPDAGDNVDALVKNADSAMFGAKQSGRNAFRFFSEPSAT